MLKSSPTHSCLLLAAAVSEPTQLLKQRLLELLGPAIAHFTRNALLYELPLAFRGCIALGQGLLEDGIFVGQAIDEAAENYERADAACVWLLDDARDAVESISPESRTGYWFLHNVPLVERKRKKGEAAVRQTLVVNPCGPTPTREDHNKLSNRMCLAFDRGEHASREDVQRKRQLTLHFLEECSRASKDWYSERGFPNAQTC